MALDRRSIDAKLEAAFERFLAVYARYGGYHYYGWDDYPDPRNYRGPMIWTEGDCNYRLGLELELEFPHSVHFEVPVNKSMFSDFDANSDKREFIDVVVSDLHDFVEDGTSQERFRTHRHELFVEGKYFAAGCSKTWSFDAEAKIPQVTADAARLARHVERGHCGVAAVLVIDDDGFFEERIDRATWPELVKLLIASPAELDRLEIEVKTIDLPNVAS